VGWSGIGVGFSGAALAGSVAVAVHLKDVDMVGQPVEQRAGEALGVEGLGPFIEREVADDQRGAAPVALRDHLEQQFGTGLGEWDEARYAAAEEGPWPQWGPRKPDDGSVWLTPCFCSGISQR